MTDGCDRQAEAAGISENFSGDTRNVVHNKGPKKRKMGKVRHTRNVNENKRLNSFLPGMLLITKMVNLISGPQMSAHNWRDDRDWVVTL